jgi:hypothetical protein
MSKIIGVKAHQGIISMSATGKRNNAYGKTWSYDLNVVPVFIPTKYSCKKILCDNGMIFESASDAARWVRSWRGSASVSCITEIARLQDTTKKAYGFKWRYVDEI